MGGMVLWALLTVTGFRLLIIRLSVLPSYREMIFGDYYDDIKIAPNNKLKT